MKKEYEFAPWLILDGFSKGQIVMSKDLKHGKPGDIDQGDFQSELRLENFTFEFDIPDDIDKALEEFRERVRKAEIKRLEEQIARLKL